MSSDPSPLPVKLYYRIGEVAQLVGVETHVIRYWESEFRSIRPQKSRSGQRVYSRRDVERLVQIRDLLYRDGFTIAGARRKLHEVGAEGKSQLDHSLLKAQLLRDALVATRDRVRLLLQSLDDPASAPDATSSSDVQ